MAYAFDAIQRTDDFNLSLAENIPDHAVKIARRYGGEDFYQSKLLFLLRVTCPQKYSTTRILR